MIFDFKNIFVDFYNLKRVNLFVYSRFYFILLQALLISLMPRRAQSGMELAGLVTMDVQ